MITFNDILKESSDQKSQEIQIPTGSSQWDISTETHVKLQHYCADLIDQCIAAFEKTDMADKVPLKHFFAEMQNQCLEERGDSQAEDDLSDVTSI